MLSKPFLSGVLMVAFGVMAGSILTNLYNKNVAA